MGLIKQFTGVESILTYLSSEKRRLAGSFLFLCSVFIVCIETTLWKNIFL